MLGLRPLGARARRPSTPRAEHICFTMPELPTSPTRRSDRQLEAWASTLMGNLDMESAAGREAFSALVKYAREKDAESRQKGALLLEAEEEIDKRDRAGEGSRLAGGVRGTKRGVPRTPPTSGPAEPRESETRSRDGPARTTG